MDSVSDQQKQRRPSGGKRSTGREKPSQHQPDTPLEVEHALAYDLVQQGEHNSRLYLFANAFSPNLGARLLHPSEFVFFKVANSYREPLHIHRYHDEFLIALEGEYSCSVNAQELILKPWEGVLIQKGDAHADHCCKPGFFLGLAFYPVDSLGRNWNGRILRETDSIREHCFSLTGDSDLKTLVELARHQADSTEPFIRQASHAFAQILIWRLLGKLESQLAPEFLETFANNLFRLRVNQLFEENLHRELPVPEMAKKLGMSRKTLENKMMRLFNCSPARAFLAFRLEHAAQLLQRGKSSKEVTRELGFSNQFHFSRIFKAHFGINASAYGMENIP